MFLRRANKNSKTSRVLRTVLFMSIIYTEKKRLIVNGTLYGIVDVILMLTLVMICSGETLKMMKFLLL